MRIGGLQKLTLLDYPGKVACTVFLSGCNLRCPYCHNPGVSGSPAGAPRQRIHCDEYDCKCLRTWLGGNAGGIKSDGGIAGA